MSSSNTLLYGAISIGNFYPSQRSAITRNKCFISESAMVAVPGRCFTLYSNWSKRSDILSIRAGGFDLVLLRISWMARLSVTNVNGRPNKYNFNLSNSCKGFFLALTVSPLNISQQPRRKTHYTASTWVCWVKLSQNGTQTDWARIRHHFCFHWLVKICDAISWYWRLQLIKCSLFCVTPMQFLIATRQTPKRLCDLHDVLYEPRAMQHGTEETVQLFHVFRTARVPQRLTTVYSRRNAISRKSQSEKCQFGPIELALVDIERNTGRFQAS